MYTSSVYVSSKLLIYLPPPSPLVTMFVCCVCESICFVNKFICIIFLDSTNKWYHMIFVFLCLTYLTWHDNSLGPSMLLQMALCHSFLWLNNITLLAYDIAIAGECLCVCVVCVCVWERAHGPSKWNSESCLQPRPKVKASREQDPRLLQGTMDCAAGAI